MENTTSVNETYSSVDVNCKILKSCTESITSNSKQPYLTILKEATSTVRNMQTITCKFCSSNQFVEDYFNHLQIHLEEMNQLCEILNSRRENNQSIDWGVMDIHCPCCKKIMVYLLPDANSQYARVTNIHQIENHARKCSWRIVSERQRIYFMSKARVQYNSSLQIPSKFFKDDYAIGAPNANGYRGSVYICPNCFGDGEGSDAATEIQGTQMGERFGHSMCAVDVNGDGFDDIVIGAPLYSTKTTVSC